MKKESKSQKSEIKAQSPKIDDSPQNTRLIRPKVEIQKTSTSISMEEFKKELTKARSRANQEKDKPMEDVSDYVLDDSTDEEVISGDENGDVLKDSMDEEDRESYENYNNLTDEVVKRKILKNTAKCQAYLEKLGIRDMEVNIRGHMITVPFEYEKYNFLSHIIVGEDWLIVKASILEMSRVPPDMMSDMMFDLLKANFILNDVTFSIDPEGKSIWVESDIPSDVEFDIFKTEYLSIVFGIDFFIKNILADFEADLLESTYKSEPKEKTGENHLYI